MLRSFYLVLREKGSVANVSTNRPRNEEILFLSLVSLHVCAAFFEHNFENFDCAMNLYTRCHTCITMMEIVLRYIFLGRHVLCRPGNYNELSHLKWTFQSLDRFILPATLNFVTSVPIYTTNAFRELGKGVYFSVAQVSQCRNR